jgi:hypothetical protein
MGIFAHTLRPTVAEPDRRQWFNRPFRISDQLPLIPKAVLRFSLLVTLAALLAKPLGAAS